MMLYKKEHLSCISYKTDESDGFRHIKVAEGGTIEFHRDSVHNLVFMLDGGIHLDTPDGLHRKIGPNEMVLVPKSCVFTYYVRENSEMIIFSFRILKSVCDKLFIQRMLEHQEGFEPLGVLPFRQPIESFIHTMVFYLNEGLNCEHLHEIKEKELFLLLRAFYSRRELTKLFHEILGEADFRSLVVQNFMRVKNIGELAALANMGRTTFDSKFKTVFGMSARQWILVQIAKQVKMKAMDPDITISDLMDEFNFNSATHFNWFCKKQFKCTPLELIRSCRRIAAAQSGKKSGGSKKKKG
ncbi:MAG: helix-turn-helix domain-containing protein [Tannerella sp.]|jgi:AraC-like DNA-binding protein|nr:helix-turn-helix domain-containing protein [Tannerella sp.]